MRLLHAGPDLAAAADLAVALQGAGHDVAALLPYDASAEGRTRPTRVRVPVPVGPQTITAEILQATGPAKLMCYLARPDEDLPADSAARGIFLSQVAVEVARRLLPSPVLLHLTGWEVALAPAYVRLNNLPFRTVLEVRDLSQQGSFDGQEFGATRLPAGFFSPGAVEFFGRLNFIKGGLVLADAFTVDAWSSYTALRTGPAAGGLGVVMAEQGYKCSPIFRPNQIAGWDPASDDFVAKQFSADSLEKKSASRSALLAATGTKRKCRGPVVLLTCRANEVVEAETVALLERWLVDDGKLVVASTDDSAPAALEAAAFREPTRATVLRGADDAALHRAVAGADFQFFPNAPTIHFAEAAWRAMRYGTIPLARDHIGRADLFGEHEGFAWFVDSNAAIWDTCGVRADKIFYSSDALHEMRTHAMHRAAKVTERTVANAHADLYRRLGVG